MQLSKPSGNRFTLERRVGDGGGSHRQSRRKDSGSERRRDRNMSDARPQAGRGRKRGKDPVPPALARPLLRPCS